MVLAERVSKIKLSPTLAVSAKADKMKADGIDIISFKAGEPDFDTPQTLKTQLLMPSIRVLPSIPVDGIQN